MFVRVVQYMYISTILLLLLRIFYFVILLNFIIVHTSRINFRGSA